MTKRESVGRVCGFEVEAIVDAAGRAVVCDGSVVRDVAKARAHAQLILRACRRAEQMAHVPAADESGPRRKVGT